jgi:hypothetical protein
VQRHLGEKVPVVGRQGQQGDAHRSRGFTGQRDAPGVAAERRDVLVHPFERGHEIVQTEVGRVAAQPVVAGEAQGSQPVVDGYHYGRRRFGEQSAAQRGYGTRSVRERTAVHPDQYR